MLPKYFCLKVDKVIQPKVRVYLGIVSRWDTKKTLKLFRIWHHFTFQYRNRIRWSLHVLQHAGLSTTGYESFPSSSIGGFCGWYVMVKDASPFLRIQTSTRAPSKWRSLCFRAHQRWCGSSRILSFKWWEHMYKYFMKTIVASDDETAMADEQWPQREGTCHQFVYGLRIR